MAISTNMKMINIRILGLGLLMSFSLIGCDDSSYEEPVFFPDAEGTFVDARDGYEYRWVRIGGLDWSVDNAHFYTDNETCTIQQDDQMGGSLVYSDKHLKKYGYLYTYQGALKAVPEGWRLPTDDDWQSLEKALGMSAREASSVGWRGNTGLLMQQESEGTMLDMKLGGYYTPYFYGDGAGYRFLGVYGFFWTSTQDTSKDGEYVFYRKLMYDSKKVYRQSMEKDGNKMSVRFVRDAQ